jgi:hypothetical protein
MSHESKKIPLIKDMSGLPSLPKDEVTKIRKLDVGGQALHASIMDDERKKQQAYDYLCHIGEAKE